MFERALREGRYLTGINLQAEGTEGKSEDIAGERRGMRRWVWPDLRSSPGLGLERDHPPWSLKLSFGIFQTLLRSTKGSTLRPRRSKGEAHRDRGPEWQPEPRPHSQPGTGGVSVDPHSEAQKAKGRCPLE